MDRSSTASGAAASHDTSTYPSFASTNTSMPPSASSHKSSNPAPSSTRSMPDHREVSQTVQTQVLDPYTALGQLSYGPATQTTVVTTTTTTTTSFPPLVLNAPRHLNQRDPKQYPLAASPTPQSIKDFNFSIGGREARFREAHDAQQTFNEYKTQQAGLQATSGTISKSADVPRPEAPRSTQKSKALSNVPTQPANNTRKRSASPVSIVEAAERASHQRKRLRPSVNTLAAGSAYPPSLTRNNSFQASRYLDTTAPATPDTDAGSTGQTKIQKVRKTSKRPSSRAGTKSVQGEKRLSNLKHVSEEGSIQDEMGDGQATEPRDTGSVANPRRSTDARESQFSIMGIDGQASGISATPPIAETDLEPILPVEDDHDTRPRIAHPNSLQNIANQDASLPSPSLSPITAAANLAQHAALPGLMGVEEEDDENDVSSLDIEREKEEESSGRRSRDLVPAHRASEGAGSVTKSTADSHPPAPTLRDLPVMVDAFDAMPDDLKTYVMYQFLRRCAKSTLHFVANVVNPALKIDFLAHLPMELSLNITSNLDAQSMCRAAQVSRKWRDVVNRDERAWKSLLDKDGYQLPEGELERAIKEGWGWQFGQDSHEKDLSGSSAVITISDSEASSSPLTAPLATSGSTRGKRKATSRYATSNKRQRRKGPATSPSKSQLQVPAALHSTSKGPSTYASLAAAAVPQPNIGLPDLRQLHLFKSLYQRHHLIRKSWMDAHAKPRHIAFRAHQRHVVTCLQFDTDKILTGSDDTNINVYDTKTGQLRNRLIGHEGGVWALQYWGNTLVSGSTDRSVRVWDIERGRCLQVFQGHTSTVRCLVILQPTEIGTDADGKPIVMPERPLIITGSRDSNLRVWKLPSLDDPSVFQTGAPANDRENPYFIRALTGHHHSVRAIAAHGDTLVSGSYDTSVRVWKISTGEVLHRLNGHTQKVYSVVLDHERNRCISGSMDNLVKVWSLETGACLFNLEGHTSLVGLLDLSHERLVSAAADSTLRIWDPENGQCKATLTAHTGAITCFQHDSQKVISGSDRTLKMWNVKTGECIKDLLTDLSGVWQVKFDQRRCVAAVQRNNMTYIEVLDFGGCRDGVPDEQLGRRIVVDQRGREIEDVDDTPEILPAEADPL